jgi:hypothetical protein
MITGSIPGGTATAGPSPALVVPPRVTREYPRVNPWQPVVLRLSLPFAYFASLSRNSLRALATFGAMTTAQYGFCGFRAK